MRWSERREATFRRRSYIRHKRAIPGLSLILTQENDSQVEAQVAAELERIQRDAFAPSAIKELQKETLQYAATFKSQSDACLQQLLKDHLKLDDLEIKQMETQNLSKYAGELLDQSVIPTCVGAPAAGEAPHTSTEAPTLHDMFWQLEEQHGGRFHEAEDSPPLERTGILEQDICTTLERLYDITEGIQREINMQTKDQTARLAALADKVKGWKALEEELSKHNGCLMKELGTDHLD